MNRTGLRKYVMRLYCELHQCSCCEKKCSQWVIWAEHDNDPKHIAGMIPHGYKDGHTDQKFEVVNKFNILLHENNQSWRKQ